MIEEPFKKYYRFSLENNSTVINDQNFDIKEEAFDLFKSLYNTSYGSIEIKGNLISIHTGGWSENEFLISDFKKTWWWFVYIKIESSGGNYYFDTGDYHDPKWEIKPS